MDNLYIYLSSCAVGIFLTVLCWQTYLFFTAVPDEDREYLDEPPALFNMLWYFIKVVAFYISPLLSQDIKLKLYKRIKYAGFDYVFSPVDIIASQLVLSLLFSIIVLPLLLISGLDFFYAIFFGIYGAFYPILWLKSEKIKRQRKILKEIPFFLDIIILCVESGLTLVGAIQQAVNKSALGATRTELNRVLTDIRSGMSKSDALKKMGSRIDEPSVQNLISAIIQAESMGMNLGPILRVQSEQRRVERFLRAEKLALEAPVKMLLPLVMFIFPCTFIVIGFPIYVMMQDAFN